MSDLIVQAGESDDSPVACCIMGPTATGKTALAMEIVDAMPADIISVDSAMVYREMDIGSAKPTPEELERAPHRLIDIVDVTDAYSAGRFVDDVATEMHSITAAGRFPVLAGGTMMYFNALQKGIAELPAADEAIRQQIEDEAESLGWQALHDRLATIDPEAAERIHPNDPQRLSRALEVYEITGRSLSSLWQDQARGQTPYRLIKIALMPPDRAGLRERITQRLDAMLETGLIEEVQRIAQRKGVHEDLPAMRSVGYRQVWQYLEGAYDRETMREKAIIATAQLAKRQMTWLRSEQNCNFIDPEELDVPKLLKNLKFLLS